jgi:hypothetical protein
MFKNSKNSKNHKNIRLPVDICESTCGEGSYCKTWQTPNVCSGCDIPCGETPPPPQSIDCYKCNTQGNECNKTTFNNTQTCPLGYSINSTCDNTCGVCYACLGNNPVCGKTNNFFNDNENVKCPQGYFKTKNCDNTCGVIPPPDPKLCYRCNNYTCESNMLESCNLEYPYTNKESCVSECVIVPPVPDLCYKCSPSGGCYQESVSTGCDEITYFKAKPDCDKNCEEKPPDEGACKSQTDSNKLCGGNTCYCKYNNIPYCEGIGVAGGQGCCTDDSECQKGDGTIKDKTRRCLKSDNLNGYCSGEPFNMCTSDQVCQDLYNDLYKDDSGILDQNKLKCVIKEHKNEQNIVDYSTYSCNNNMITNIDEIINKCNPILEGNNDVKCVGYDYHPKERKCYSSNFEKCTTIGDITTCPYQIQRTDGTEDTIDFKIPPFLNLDPNNGNFRYTLWHEGVKNVNKMDLKLYFKEMTDFVIDKKIDRVFFQLNDPYALSGNGTTIFPFSNHEFVIENMIIPLQDNNVQIGVLLDMDPKYVWYYDTSLNGGIGGNNPDYKNNINLDNETCTNNLEQGFKYIGDINKLAKKKGYKRLFTTVAFDGEGLGAYGADNFGMVQAWQAARKYAPDVNEIGIAKGPNMEPRSIWSNAAYPELYWIGEIPAPRPVLNSSGNYDKNKFCHKFNGKDGEMINNCFDSEGNCNTTNFPESVTECKPSYITGNCCDDTAPSDKSDCYKNDDSSASGCTLKDSDSTVKCKPRCNYKCINVDPDFKPIDNQEEYPCVAFCNSQERIKKAESIKDPKELDSGSLFWCNNKAGVKNTIYRKYCDDKADDLKEFWDKFSKWFPKSLYNKDDPESLKGICPLFSLEAAHKKDGKTFNDDCTQYRYDNSGFCGTFDGFGTWSWEKFDKFATMFHIETGIKDIGIYEWQFVPSSWKRAPEETLPSKQHTPTPIKCAGTNCKTDCTDCDETDSKKMGTGWIVLIVIGCLAFLVFVAYLIKRYRSKLIDGRSREY